MEGELHEVIPIALELGDTTLALGADGKWETVHSKLQETACKAEALAKRNEELESENTKLKDKCERLVQESNMDKFKCQLLVEMLAIASLDEERSKKDAEEERAKCSSVRKDLMALLEQARREGVDVRKLGQVLEPTAEMS